MVRNILGGIGILAVAGLVASALASKGTGASTAGSHPSASAGATASSVAAATAATASAAQPTGPGVVGSYFNVQDGSGDTYQVTLVRVIDPGQNANQFATPVRGSRLVGIVFRITALTGSPQGEDADNDCTVLGNDGKIYSAVFDSIVGYSNFEVGVIHVAQGDTVTGAVTFQLPQYIKVVTIRWVGSDGLGSSVYWNVAAKLARSVLRRSGAIRRRQDPATWIRCSASRTRGTPGGAPRLPAATGPGGARPLQG
jgi:hypothetical protein